ncbi:Glyoxalase/Bleomycin resistance protein/Dioxygenase superfamily protein [Amycolatopsis arida]|uniref:Glyoxalase/Bleomycin resistance protein/Dioxygenase superfamily protein n=1 Tax=Amycolatopsis arida TaxID=587909 RepID=A0A1I5KLE4_9PSEU|nr:VOC family protein [Amycolatopsis arida]TDX97099.1 glyoxalase/bleomycin resistance protein/dioxygenase superfamily protein [Amycolatopsis arida]SFO85707.1 Glyoxalase/Bleomycin resistance protein/Dioxygenase superfamily protein [Amycolatopsis arida]
MTLELGMVTIDCADPRRLADFWSAALGLRVDQDYGEYLVLAGRDGGVRLGLQRVPEPRAGKNRLHLDLVTEDRAREVARLVGLGAMEVAEHDMPGLGWTVLTDLEGNLFCVGEEH